MTLQPRRPETSSATLWEPQISYCCMKLVNFTFIWPCIVTYIFIIIPTRCTNFPNLLRHETLHVSGSSSAHHQEFIQSTLGTGMCHTSLKTAFKRDRDGTAFIHCTLGIGICHTGLKTAFEQDQDVPSSSRAVYKPVWHIPVPSVQWINSWWWAEELPETYRVSCRSKFGKLVHLVGIKKLVKSIYCFVACSNYVRLESVKTAAHSTADNLQDFSCPTQSTHEWFH